MLACIRRKVNLFSDIRAFRYRQSKRGANRMPKIGLSACGDVRRCSWNAARYTNWDARLQMRRYLMRRNRLIQSNGSLAVHALIEFAGELDHFRYLFPVPHAALVFALLTGRGRRYVFHVDRHSLFHILQLVFGARGE